MMVEIQIVQYIHLQYLRLNIVDIINKNVYNVKRFYKQKCLFFEWENYMFLGLFIVLASLLTLLEEFGYITANVKWGLPLAFACFGLSLIFEKFKNNTNK
jgi:hypothetical protein